MYLEIVTPEAVVFKAEVDAVKVPGVNGEFQMLNNHAPIVSSLAEGEVKINLTSDNRKVLEELSEDFRKDAANNSVLYYTIDGGVLEMKDNRAIILAD
ncbi:FoF1 ATP synthase subunit delta/epsilon [Salegentibacter chungangensis]|uniref:FoF1 ATP synthase subunit delta/epsilon n=1 Tax=Salegentibacter chungangensis TaxID=1335724 RepID=A0ABW3NPL7_9FLAO